MIKIYTKQGDGGMTSVLGGKRVPKSCLEMEAIGEVDELNSWLGVLVEEIEEKFPAEARKLKGVQKCLFRICTELASVQVCPVACRIPTGRRDKCAKRPANLQTCKLANLEKWIDVMEKKLPKLNHFIAYEGTEEAVKAFYARAICRRAERAVVGLFATDKTSPQTPLLQGEGNEIKKYLNRLSDLLFVLGRWMNR